MWIHFTMCVFFFFSSRRRHTRFDCDWSSDVCSSDLNQAGWTSTLYYDANNNGTLDATDPQIGGNLNTVAGLARGLAPGQSITLFAKGIAPSGALPGAGGATPVPVTPTHGPHGPPAPAPARAPPSHP